MGLYASESTPVILIVEDEVPTRHLIRRALTRAGYATLEAADTRRAEAVVGAYPGKLQLAILDVVTSSGSGLDFANQLGIERPGTKVLYISSIADSIATESIRRGQPSAMLMKPFARRQLLNRVQDLIGANPLPHSA